MTCSGTFPAGLAGLSYASSLQSLIDLFFRDSYVVAAGLRPASGFAHTRGGTDA